MADQGNGARYAQYLSAVAILDERMKHLEVIGTEMELESTASSDILPILTNEENEKTHTEVPQTAIDGGADNTKLNSLNVSSDTDKKIMEVHVEEVKHVEDDKYLNTFETKSVIVPCSPKPTVFTRGTKLNPIQYTFIDTIDLVRFMLDNIIKWSTTGISLFVDLEGKDLGSRDGNVHLMSIYHKLTRHTYLVGVSELGEAAFMTRGTHNVSLRDILESRTIIKAFWDARIDSAGLFREFGVKLVGAGVVDAQLVICRATGFRNEYNRPRLDDAINTFCMMSPEIRAKMTHTKAAGKRMWKPAMGGSFDVFAERPLSQLIIAYCVNDTYFLDEILECGMARASGEDLAAVKNLCEEQLRAITRPSYRFYGRDKARNPFFVPPLWESDSEYEF